MAGISNQITNIIGTPLPNFVRLQLNDRAKKTSLKYRDDNNYKFLANKTGWIRVISSVDLITQSDLAYFKQTVGANIAADSVFGAFSDPQSLAEQYILFGGTSKYVKVENGASYRLRSGINYDGAYGMLGKNEIEQYGYRPMPGITSAKITTQGRLGSVRSAEISFKVWDKFQLDIIDALYLKLGFSMFIEWGNTTFYNTTTGKLESGEDYSIDVFDRSLIQDKDTVRTRIYENIVKSDGNYDAMLGIVTNFNYSFSQDGGYDCSIKVLSLGILADSMKVNKIQELPNIAKDQISTIFNALQSLEQKSAERKRAEEEAKQQALLDANKKKEEEAAKTRGEKPINDYTSFVDLVVNSTDKERKESYAVTEVQGSTNKNYYAVVKKGRDQGVKLAVLKNLSNIITLYNDSRYKVSIKVPSELNTADEYWNRLEQTVAGVSYESGISGDIKQLVQNDIVVNDTLDKDVEKYINLRKYPNPNAKYDTSYDSKFNSYNQNSPNADTTGVGISYIVGTNTFRVNVVFGLNGFYVDGHDAKIGNFDAKDNKNVIPFTETDIEKIEAAINNGIAEVKKALPAGGTANNLLLESESDETFKTYFDISRTGDPFYPNQGKLSVRLKTYYTVNTTIDSEDTATAVKSGQKQVTAFYPIWIMFNDSDLILSAKEYKGGTEEEVISSEEVEETDSEEAKPITVADVQKSESLKYKSSIEIMLRTIQLKQIADSFSKITIGEGGSFQFREANQINLLDTKYLDSFTKPLFSSGLFTEFFSDLIDNKITNDQEFIKVAAKYGFNSNFMRDPSGFLEFINKNFTSQKLKDELAVDYKSLMYSYIVPYKVENNLGEGLNLPSYPVYITLGAFLMMLNHMCVLYNQQDQEKVKKPLIYIDFNNKTNFCLANELVLSTNPLAFLVPFEGTRKSYKKLFEDIADKGEDVFTITVSGSATPLFDPENKKEDNILSALLFPKYRYSEINGAVDKTSAYRGNIMNILVNIDYLLNTVDSFIKEDDEATVYLKPLLEKIVSDINKAMGNINVFRVAFNDYADTYYIVDDQVVPPNQNQSSINSFGKDSKFGASDDEQDPNKSLTELPLFGKKSIANSLEIKTEISTRLSNMIAISANSKIDQKYAASKDASAVGYLNTGFQDRYKKRILDQIPNNSGSINDVTRNAAVQFNQIIKNFYSSDTAPLNDIETATQYFMEKMNKIKAVEPPTRASAMIPVSVNFSTDGISGMAMGQSFTIQDELLPYSYTTRKMPYGMPNYQKKVGFVVIGLDHEISNNRWTTSVRSNMYFIKDTDMYSKDNLRNYTSDGTSATFRSSDSFASGDSNLQGTQELYWLANFIHNQGPCGATSILNAASLGIPSMDADRNPGYKNPFCAKHRGTDSIQYNMFGRSDGYPSSDGNVGSNFKSVIQAAGGSLSPLYTPANFTLYKKAQFIEKYNSANSLANEKKYAGIFAYFEEASKKYGVPLDYIKYVAYCESGFDPNAGNKKYKGLFAISDQDFQRLVPGGNIYDARDNTIAGVQMLKETLEKAETLRNWYYGGMSGNPFR